MIRWANLPSGKQLEALAMQIRFRELTLSVILTLRRCSQPTSYNYSFTKNLILKSYQR